MLIRGVVSSPVRGVVGSGFGGGDTFSLDAFMASQSDGFWYDLRRRDSMFQQSGGPTPADDPGELIGLALDQRLWGGQTLPQVVAGAAELVVNGNFATDTAWTRTQATISGGIATINSPDGTFAGIRQDIAGVAGRLYAISFDLLSLSGDAPTVDFGATGVAQVSSALDRKTVFLVASGASNPLFIKRTSGVTLFTIDNVSVREVSQVPATQSTTSFKPKWQTDGAAFDGTDDNLLTNYTAGSGANFLIAKVVVPASIASTQIFLGGGGGPWSVIGVDSAGQLRAGLGSSLVSAGPDLRGQTVVVGVTSNGETELMFVGGSLVNSRAASAPDTSNALRIGARNSASTALNFFGGSIQHALAGREFIDLARFNQIANALQ